MSLTSETVLRPTFHSMVFFITRTLQTENPFCITSSCHSHKVLHVFKKGVTTSYKKNVALNGALALKLHFFCQRPHLPYLFRHFHTSCKYAIKVIMSVHPSTSIN